MITTIRNLRGRDVPGVIRRNLLLARSLTALLLIAGLIAEGCGSITFRGSSNLSPMLDQFPFRADQPLARELRYTYMTLTVLDGKKHKSLFAADEATRAKGSSVPSPAAVITSGSTTGSHYSDEISQKAREAAKRGEDRRYVAGLHGMAASQGRAEVALERARATVDAAFAAYNALAALSALAQWWTDSAASALGEWVRHNTGTIGPKAGEGSVLQLDFTYVNTGRSFRVDSRSDLVVTATLQDGHGRIFESQKGFQLYTYMDTPSMEVPADATPVPNGLVSPEKRPLIQELSSKDVWNPYLAVAACSALADLYRQVNAAQSVQEKP